MSETWFDRFVEAVEADNRSYTQLSLDAGLGQNFVQQAIKNKKVPSVEKFMAVLDALGSASALYVLSGIKMDRDDEAFLRAALSLDDDLKQQARKFFETLQASARNSAQGGAPQQEADANGQRD